jgi:hypothetical protein
VGIEPEKTGARARRFHRGVHFRAFQAGSLALASASAMR